MPGPAVSGKVGEKGERQVRQQILCLAFFDEVAVAYPPARFVDQVVPCFNLCEIERLIDLAVELRPVHDLAAELFIGRFAPGRKREGPAWMDQTAKSFQKAPAPLPARNVMEHSEGRHQLEPPVAKLFVQVTVDEVHDLEARALRRAGSSQRDELLARVQAEIGEGAFELLRETTKKPPVPASHVQHRERRQGGQGWLKKVKHLAPTGRRELVRSAEPEGRTFIEASGQAVEPVSSPCIHVQSFTWICCLYSSAVSSWSSSPGEENRSLIIQPLP